MADTEKFSPALLQVERISNLEGWRRLEHEWNALLQDSAADAVFLCWEWMDTWLEVYGDGGEWIILTVRDPNGWLLGVAPMMLDKGSGIVGRWQRRLLLLGQKADTASEYLDWILRRGYESAAVESFAAFILSEKFVPWDILEFTSMRSDAASILLLIAAFKKRGVVITQNQTVTSPYMILPETWEAFLAGQRAKFRQRWNKFHREHQVTVKFVGQDMTVAEGMSHIRQLNESRWGVRRQSFLSDRYRCFHDHVALRFHEKEQLLMLFLAVDGQIVAGRYDFVYGNKGWSFQGGWLPEWERISIGKLMLTQVVQTCIDKGLAEYDFLGGDSAYKKDWSNGERTLVNLNAVNPASYRGMVFSWLKAIKQRYRHLKALKLKTK
jgi:CelD/BcsL family acetyltransferase involved in cellulose biosynthesis